MISTAEKLLTSRIQNFELWITGCFLLFNVVIYRNSFAQISCYFQKILLRFVPSLNHFPSKTFWYWHHLIFQQNTPSIFKKKWFRSFCNFLHFSSNFIVLQWCSEQSKHYLFFYRADLIQETQESKFPDKTVFVNNSVSFLFP